MSAIPTQGSTFEKIEIYPLGGEGDLNTAVDMRLGITFFQYFEDLMSPVITATMGVTSSGEGVYNTLPIRGGEEVKLHFTTPIELHREETPGKLELTMYVNKVSDYASEKQKETFTLHLVSKEGITNLNKRIIKKYKQKRVDEVIADFLDILECDYDKEDIEKSSTKVNFIGNMRKPFTLVPMLSSRAVPVGANSSTAGFFLWQTKSGIKFKSIETIIKNKEVSHEYFYNRRNDGLIDPEISFTKILGYSVHSNNNVMAAQKTGEYSTYRIYFNPYTFEFTKPTDSVFKPQGKTEQEKLGSEESPIMEEAKPEKIPNPEMAHRIVSGVYACGTLEEIADINVSAASTAINQQSLDDVGQSISRYASIFNQVLTMTVGLNVYLEAGDIIKCTFPQVSADNDIDHSQSGLYIIKEISHFISGNKSYSALKVIRDTFGD
tara:strand:- start:2382 stop:3689 length:1308 start_codon:yes stop_codon:yes gene_type:complete